MKKLISICAINKKVEKTVATTQPAECCWKLPISSSQSPDWLWQLQTQLLACCFLGTEVWLHQGLLDIIINNPECKKQLLKLAAGGFVRGFSSITTMEEILMKLRRAYQEKLKESGFYPGKSVKNFYKVNVFIMKTSHSWDKLSFSSPILLFYFARLTSTRRSLFHLKKKGTND